MKRNYLLMVMLFCLAMVVGCEKPDKEKGEEGIEHHPTSSFDKCPLLAHIDNPKLGIKQITITFDRDTNALFYDENQKLIKVIHDYQTKDEDIVVYTYDNEGRMTKISWNGGNTTRTYDKYGFLTEWKDVTDDGDYDTYKYTYDGKTVTRTRYNKRNEKDYMSFSTYNDDMYLIERKTILNYEERIYENNYKYEWRDGNMTKYTDSGNRCEIHTYDEHPSIESLMGNSLFGQLSKNNILSRKINYSSGNSKNNTYTLKYNNKGLIEEKQGENEAGRLITTRYEYIYY